MRATNPPGGTSSKSSGRSTKTMFSPATGWPTAALAKTSVLLVTMLTVLFRIENAILENNFWLGAPLNQDLKKSVLYEVDGPGRTTYRSPFSRSIPYVERYAVTEKQDELSLGGEGGDPLAVLVEDQNHWYRR